MTPFLADSSFKATPGSDFQVHLSTNFPQLTTIFALILCTIIVPVTTLFFDFEILPFRVLRLPHINIIRW